MDFLANAKTSDIDNIFLNIRRNLYVVKQMMKNCLIDDG